VRRSLIAEADGDGCRYLPRLVAGGLDGGSAREGDAHAPAPGDTSTRTSYKDAGTGFAVIAVMPDSMSSHAWKSTRVGLCTCTRYRPDSRRTDRTVRGVPERQSSA